MLAERRLSEYPITNPASTIQAHVPAIVLGLASRQEDLLESANSHVTAFRPQNGQTVGSLVASAAV